ncbi:Gfo/Idh/MocA family oxidoreductase [Sphingorhabdus sp. YGSMI21]|uniref:Gfo/Idh/MocA family protein n=1 Tax=Sphingorhabdus sp. YGSMI21 TaxID=2077182 RepID=UPI000C1EEA4C|nr:Gfo/Idh/MocA family oxidoreductase [Sphingorhabdus sp. YGSMI21]ATW03385.1 oxidoreductase [Sphingorhabdus sp. YGSMI21]
MKTESIGLALVGCGRISAAHLAAVSELDPAFRLVVTVDPDLTAAQAAAEPFGASAFADVTEALTQPGIDAVLIASPNGMHFEQARTAIAAGKHVLVEKPLAETGAQALQLSKAAVEAGVILAAGHTFRHGPAVRTLMERLPGFGKLLAVEVSQCVFWDGPQAPWWADRKPDDSLILSLFAPHALDFVQLVMGRDDPLRVHVEAARHQSGWQAEDEAMMLFAYPERKMASVHISYNQPHVHDRKTLFFDQGVAEIQDGELLRWNNELLVEPPAGTFTDSSKMGGRDLSHYFTAQLMEFAKAVRGEPHHCPTGQDAARLIGLIDLVREKALHNSADAIAPNPMEKN